MANTNDVFDDLLTKKESYFIPTSSGSRGKQITVPNVRGEFFGHLQGATMKEVSWARDGKKFKAVVYNYQFEVAKGKKQSQRVRIISVGLIGLGVYLDS